MELPITHWLTRWREGDKAAGDALAANLQPLLRKTAAIELKKNPPPPGEDIGVTALLHEAWARVSPGRGGPFQNREHFMGVVVLAMRRFLIGRHRARPRGIEPVPMAQPDEHDTAAIDIRLALHALEATHPRQALALLLSKLAGMKTGEIAQALGISEATARRDLRFAEAYIRVRLKA